jgi:hypothetical protein
VVWPGAEIELPLNPVFQLLACLDSPSRLQPTLISESGEEIELDFVRELHRSSSLVQPRLPLRPLTRYALIWRGADADTFDPVWFRTGSETDYQAPQWREPPRLDLEKSGVEGGPRAALTTSLVDVEEPVQSMVSFRRSSDSVLSKDWPAKPAVEGNWTGVRLGGSSSWQPGVLGYAADYVVAVSFLDLSGNESEVRTVRFRTPDAPPDTGCQAFTTVAEGTVRWKEEPRCSPLAIRARVQGMVEGSLRVAADGSVLAVEISKGLPMGLDEATRQSLSKWRLQPSKVPLERRVTFRTVFVLSTEAYEPKWKELP